VLHRSAGELRGWAAVGITRHLDHRESFAKPIEIVSLVLHGFQRVRGRGAETLQPVEPNPPPFRVNEPTFETTTPHLPDFFVHCYGDEPAVTGSFGGNDIEGFHVARKTPVPVLVERRGIDCKEQQECHNHRLAAV
jgi:hypothetical protein